MANENEAVDVLHELNELHDLIWEYGDDCICLHEGSEGATIESTDKINEKFEIIKRELAAKDALIKELADALNYYLTGECLDCGTKCEKDDACVHQKNLRALVAKARERVK